VREKMGKKQRKMWKYQLKLEKNQQFDWSKPNQK